MKDFISEKINSYNSNSRLWIFQSLSLLTNYEKEIISNKLNNFFSNWDAHGKSLKSSSFFVYSNFLIVLVDSNLERRFVGIYSGSSISNNELNELYSEIQILIDEMTNLLPGDINNDGILNDVDNCPETPNPLQSDIDNDQIGDVCDPNPIPQNTFTLQSTDESCSISNDGQLSISIL